MFDMHAAVHKSISWSESESTFTFVSSHFVGSDLRTFLLSLTYLSF